MKLWDIVKNVGSSIIREAVPGGGLIIDMVNALLPEEHKLGGDATGEDINNAVAGLPPAARASIMEKEFDVEITQIKESNSTLRTMLESDAKNPHSTRPKIALQAFYVVAFISIMVVSMWSYAVVSGDEKLVKAVVDGWPWVLAIVGPFVGWLNNYFGTLRAEHKNRLDAAAGAPKPSGIAAIIAAFKGS